MKFNKLNGIENTKGIQKAVSVAKSGVNQKMDDVKLLLDKLGKIVEGTVTDVGHFDLKLEQKNTYEFNYFNSFGIIIKPIGKENSTERVVRFFAKHDDGLYQESANIITGNRQDILEYVKYGNIEEDLRKYMFKASTEFFSALDG